jgi:hypothetical protein
MVVRAPSAGASQLGGMAGAAMASAQSRDSARPRGAGVNIGPITITAQGGTSQEVVQSVFAGLEAELAGLFERHLEGVGA